MGELKSVKRHKLQKNVPQIGHVINHSICGHDEKCSVDRVDMSTAELFTGTDRWLQFSSNQCRPHFSRKNTSTGSTFQLVNRC